MKYKKKPVEIDAFAFGVDEVPGWFWEGVKKGSVKPVNIYGWELAYTFNQGKPYCIVYTLEGKMIALEGDYIIKGIQGELYPCKPDIFVATYDKVEETVKEE